MTRKISALKVQKKDSNRVNVYLDGEFAMGLTRITAAWLKVGQILNDHEVEQLIANDVVEKAYLKALRYLSYKPRSEREIKDRLSKYGYEDRVIELVQDKLVEKGYVDDHQFAEMWVENRTNFRPRSSKLLRWELRNKKVSEEIISSILEEIDSEENLARAAALKYIHRLSNCEHDQFNKRLAGFLSRRGFSYAVCAPILAEMWESVIQKKSENEKSEIEVKDGE